MTDIASTNAQPLPATIPFIDHRTAACESRGAA